ncbi:acyltransferase family protein [Sphingomonas sp. PAMC 26621]|uniref:acyltransferase family protein n=1 Tax=Sphingomonas sp. PAMC 26621 TaxID=1112213 RepID=UPI0002883888|nr:acyltransferase [Sphingomonas sp. PAMC 26621]
MADLDISATSRVTEHSQAATPDTRSPHRYLVLDSMRGICACIIVLLHLSTQGYISNSQFVRNGFLFVDFFFVLSGFVIAASYGSRLSKGFSPVAFMALRLGRVYPMHLVMLALFLAFEIAFAVSSTQFAGRAPFSEVYGPGLLVANLALVQIFFGPDRTSWNAPSWSIAAEVWTYLVFAMIFRLAGRWLVPICAAIAVASCLYLAMLTDRYLEVFHNGAFARCLYGFSLGVIAYAVQQRIRSSASQKGSQGLWTLGEAAMVVAVIAAVTFSGPSVSSLAIPPLFLLVILLFAQENGRLSYILTRKPFVFVGTLSYSIYMIHSFLELRFVNVISAVGRIIHRPLVVSVSGHNEIGFGPLFGDAMSLLMLAITIACAILSYRWIEQKMNDRTRKWVASRFHTGVRASEDAAPTF